MRRDEAGVGLVEAAVVLGLIGILAGAAVPGIHHIRQEWALWSGARLLESSLLWARMHAIATNDSLVLIIEDGGGGFHWEEPGGARYELSARRFPAGVRVIQSPRRPLRFYQHGNAAPAGTFVLAGEAGRYRVVVSFLGRVRVERN
jgi:Tfp pilus assembly protein FimT